MRIKANPERDWLRFGELDPYYGVLTSDKFKNKFITEAIKEEFFDTGVKHMRTCLDLAETLFSIPAGGRALDFGCGVGRLTCAMAPYFSEVVGLDISPGMLTEARKESTKRALNNIVYDLSTVDSRFAPGTYDFIHSFLVFQHIPVSKGEYIIGNMLVSLKSHGLGAIHLNYGKSRGLVFSPLIAIRNFLPLRPIVNFALGEKWDYPGMQLNKYNLPRIFKIFSDHNINKLFVHRVDDGCDVGLYLFFQKPDCTAAPPPFMNPRPISLKWY